MAVKLAKTDAEVREILNDKTALTELLDPKNPESLVDWMNGSIEARLSADPDIAAQVNEQAEKFMINWLRDNPNAEVDAVAKRLNLDNPNARSRIAPNTVYNKKAEGAKFDNEFENTTDFLHAISNLAFKDADLSKKLGPLENAASSVKPSDGGFLVPEILRAELLRVALEQSIVRSRARVIPMDSKTISFPMVDSTSNVSSVFGGVVGYWTEEGATLTESSPKFGRIKLDANKLTLYTEVPTELLRDSRPSMEAFINGIFPEAISWFEDVAFFIGGGVGEPLGFLNAPANIPITRSTTVAGNNVEWVDITAMYARMLPQSLGRAVWVISPDVLPSLLNMVLPGGTSPVIIGGGSFATGSVAPVMSLLGCPIIVSEKAAAVGGKGDINFVDFGFYLLGDRQAMTAAQSEEFKFKNDVTAFRVIERLDGRPWLHTPITPMNNGATLSPFVQLAAAA